MNGTVAPGIEMTLDGSKLLGKLPRGANILFSQMLIVSFPLVWTVTKKISRGSTYNSHLLLHCFRARVRVCMCVRRLELPRSWTWLWGKMLTINNQKKNGLFFFICWLFASRSKPKIDEGLEEFAS